MSAVTSPPKSETEVTRTNPRPTARSSSTVALVPPVIAPVVTAPSPYDHLTREEADWGGDEIEPADAGVLPGTTTLTPKELAEDAGEGTTAPEELTETSVTKRRAPRTTRKRTAGG